jgi:hypothetical protein
MGPGACRIGRRKSSMKSAHAARIKENPLDDLTVPGP